MNREDKLKRLEERLVWVQNNHLGKITDMKTYWVVDDVVSIIFEIIEIMKEDLQEERKIK